LTASKFDRAADFRANVWHYLVQIEGSGIRTALAVVLPLIVGQVSRHPLDGLMIGLGGLYTAIADRNSPPLRSLIFAAVAAALAMLLGTLAGGHIWIATALMFCIAFLAAMLLAYSEMAGHIGYIATLVLAVAIGLPGTTADGALRFAEIVAGGLLATILTAALRRIDAPPAVPSDGKNSDSIRSELRCTAFHALHVAFAAGLAIALAKLLRLEHGSWLALTVLVIVKRDFPNTRKRALERVGGSLLGGAIALILASVVHNMLVIDLLLAILSVLAFSQLRRNYPLYVIYLTPFVVLMLNMLKPGDWRIALTRIEETLAGGALAIATALLFQAIDSRGAGSAPKTMAQERGDD